MIFESKKEPDGTYTIFSVPIFELGSHRGKTFDEPWFDKVKATHQELENKGYYPSLIVGHNDDKAEKPVSGFFRNLGLKGKQIVADLFKILEEDYQKLRERRYPHRSVEIFYNKNRIDALALLGGTTPYHKLPILEVYKEQLEGLSRFGEEKGERIEIQIEEDSMSEEAKKFSEEELEAAKLSAEATYKQLFKEQHGYDPEELLAEMQKRDKEAENASIDDFCESLKVEKDKTAIAPVVVDSYVKPFLSGLSSGKVMFAEKEYDTKAAAKELITAILDKARENKLVVKFGETATVETGSPEEKKTIWDDRENVNPESLKIHKKALKYQDEHKCSYADAILKVLE
jgi:hypothetical protein